jgi:hypothetical protein
MIRAGRNGFRCLLQYADTAYVSGQIGVVKYVQEGVNQQSKSETLEQSGADRNNGNKNRKRCNIITALWHSYYYLYMEGGHCRVIAGSERACKEGEESKVLEMPCVDCGLGNRYQQNTYSICKMYIHGEGRYGVQPSL